MQRRALRKDQGVAVREWLMLTEPGLVEVGETILIGGSGRAVSRWRIVSDFDDTRPGYVIEPDTTPTKLPLLRRKRVRDRRR